jgi:hypothetical protein
MRLYILNLLSCIPFRTGWGITIDSYLKDIYYKKIGRYEIGSQHCLCGGKFKFYPGAYSGWFKACMKCGWQANED